MIFLGSMYLYSRDIHFLFKLCPTGYYMTRVGGGVRVRVAGVDGPDVLAEVGP